MYLLKSSRERKLTLGLSSWPFWSQHLNCTACKWSCRSPFALQITPWVASLVLRDAGCLWLNERLKNKVFGTAQGAWGLYRLLMAPLDRGKRRWLWVSLMTEYRLLVWLCFGWKVSAVSPLLKAEKRFTFCPWCTPWWASNGASLEGQGRG